MLRIPATAHHHAPDALLHHTTLTLDQINAMTFLFILGDHSLLCGLLYGIRSEIKIYVTKRADDVIKWLFFISLATGRHTDRDTAKNKR